MGRGRKMKRSRLVIEALFLMSALVAPFSFAAECGKNASSKRLDEHAQALLTASQRISDHSRSINEDVGRRLANASTQAAFSDIDRMNFQITVLDSVKGNADL